MADVSADALVETEWLASRLGAEGHKVLDASYFVPGGIEPARQQYLQGHIPTAMYFDINDVADASASKEHAFPTAETFARKVGALGMGNNDHVIVYDHLGGTCAAARVWFMFRAFEHTRVSVLNGGRTKWIAEGRQLTTETPEIRAATFRAALRDRIKRKSDILFNISTGGFQLLDARSQGRFEGTEPEPRAGLRSGHVPGSLNLPFLTLIDMGTKTWKDTQSIRAAFAQAGVDLAKPLVTTCGSGVSACALALGAYLAGKIETAIYDGSWVEWGRDTAAPIETGAGKQARRR